MTEREIFLEALELDAPAARAAYIKGACGRDPTLQRRVDELLREHFSPDGPLSGPALAVERSVATASPMSDTATPMIGRYKLLEKIGEGGFGEVWMAEQREPVKRRVALKIIKLGMDTRQVIARFEAERQALAMMDHPNIARILDAGTTGGMEKVEGRMKKEEAAPLLTSAFNLLPSPVGRPYFVMELVRGMKITEYCDKNQLSTHDRLRLFILVCRAIQHAHQKGVIHRDIKPSNILVTLHDGVPVPKVIDFGIAKATQQELTDKTVFTQFQQFIGTPAYISPEQAEMSGLDIDTRSDIYSLGVLLYELLVGQTPFDAKEMIKGGIDALRRIIREKEPARPSTRLKTLSAVELTSTAQRRQTDASRLTHLLHGDLDWIVMKCLEKDRARRYETANGLAADLLRYLANEPIVARPPTTAYRIRKMVRRNRTAFAAAACVGLALVLGLGAVFLVQHRSNQDYRQRLYVSEIGRAGTAWQSGRTAQMLTLLDRCPPHLRHWEWTFLRQQANRWEPTLRLSSTHLSRAGLSADGRLVAVATDDVIQIREFATGQWLRNIPFASTWHSPFLTSSSDDRIATLAGPPGILTAWDLHTGEQLAQMSHGARVTSFDWSPDGQWLASGGLDGVIRIFDPGTGEELRALPTTAPVTALAVSPDGRTLAAGLRDNGIHLLDASTGAIIRRLRGAHRFVNRLSFSPDGRKLASSNQTSGGFGRDNRLWSLDPDEGSMDLNTGTDALAFAFSPDSRQLWMADSTGTIRLWDLERRAEIDRFSAHVGAAHSIRLLPDGRILSAGGDDALRVWQPRPSGIAQLEGYPHSLRTLAVSSDARWLATAGLHSEVFLWDLRDHRRAGLYPHPDAQSSAVAFGPDGAFATATADGLVRLWNTSARDPIWIESLAPATNAWGLAFSPDGRRLYAASQRETVTILDPATGERLHTIGGLGNVVDGLAVSPDGRLLAVCNKIQLSVWLADGSRELWRAPANPNRSAAFSPDSQWIATGDQDGAISLWEVAAAGSVRRRLPGHAASVSGVSFSPDGRRLVSSSFDGQVKVWDWTAGAELLTLPLPAGGQAWQVVFTPDGKTIAAAGGDGLVTLWKTE